MVVALKLLSQGVDPRNLSSSLPRQIIKFLPLLFMNHLRIQELLWVHQILLHGPTGQVSTYGSLTSFCLVIFDLRCCSSPPFVIGGRIGEMGILDIVLDMCFHVLR